ncbi:hypothetical protein GCM10027449_26190 [Sinomonas notoginsengisoli]
MWSQSTGAQLSLNGPIRDAWGASGFEGGPLGYPTTGIIGGLVNGGTYQSYQNGAIIYSPATGAQISLNGPIRNTWGASGFEGGPLGYPTTGIIGGLVNGGTYQSYQNGAIIYSPATGAQISLNGPIRDAWASTGYEQGRYGYPTSNDTCSQGATSCSQFFEHGSISWSQQSGIVLQ